MLLDMLAARADLLPALAAVSLAVGGLSIAPAIIAVMTIGTVWVSAEGYQRHDANTAQQRQQIDPGVGVAKTTKPVKAAQGARDE